MSFQDWEILRGLRKEFLDTVELAYVFGNRNAFLITKKDKIYGLGDNEGGCLGLGNSNRYGLPTEVLTLSKKGVKELMSGGDSSNGMFVVAYLRSGELYWWGLINPLLPPIYCLQKIGNGLKIIVKTIACGKSHSVILSDDGKVFACGDNNEGVLGQGYLPSPNNFGSICEPQRVKGIIENKIVTDVSCGYEFSVVLLDNGKVVTWGCNKDGQLGINCSGDSSPTPVEVSSLSDYYDAVVEKITCGRDHVLALSNTRTLYGWGAACYGQLGFRSNRSLVNGCPTEVETNNLRFTNIGASYLCNLSAAQCEKGKVYIWGETSKEIILKPTETTCESVEQVFVFFAKPNVMLRPTKLKNTPSRPVETPNGKFKNPRMLIYIKGMTGTTSTMRIEPTDTIERIKEHIQEIQGIPVGQQRLVYKGQQQSDVRTAQECNFVEGCTIFIHLRLCGD